MKYLKLYEDFSGESLITLNRESTGQKIILDEEESAKGYEAIQAALQTKSIGNDMGLVAEDFTVNVEGRVLRVYGPFGNVDFTTASGCLISDEGGEFYHFEYGKKWHTMFEDELRDILENDPEYFLRERD